MTRRALLKSSGALSLFLLSSTSLATAILAQPAPEDGPVAFDFDILAERMALLATQEHAYPQPALLPGFENLGYDGYRLIHYRPERTRWLEESHGFLYQAFHLGWLYPEAVQVHEIVDGQALPSTFSAADFEYRDPALQSAADALDFPGVAGFRVNYPMSGADAGPSEMISFVGASYFRALGRDNIYGLSARGIAVNTWNNIGEEFPRFSEFWLEQPGADGSLVIYASLEGASLTGAYRFTIQPATPERQETVVNVTARLFFRSDIAELGIAPLTSMFLFAEANRGGFDDFRPQVHDSNGLLVERANGEVLWRALNNSDSLGNSYLSEVNPAAFGLYQRGRDFASYQDAGAHYERRPSVRIEPVGDWGAGLVRLVEIPAQLEADDNIVAFWISAEPARAGERRELQYRMIWGDLDPDPAGPLAHVVETRSGIGGFSGTDIAPTTRKFVVDFAGDALTSLPAGSPIDLFNTAANGRIVSATLSPIDDGTVMRAVLDVEPDGNGPLELKAYLVGAGRVLTETWLYQWRPSVS